MSTGQIVRAYGAAWNEGDEGQRRKLLEESWSDDGVYCDPTARVESREALVAHIARSQSLFPGHRIDLVSGVDEHDGLFRFAWEMRDPAGSTILEGVDFGVLAPDGRIASITGFFGPLPELSA